MYAIGALIAVAATPAAVDAAEEYLDSARGSSDEDELLESVAVTGIAGFLTVAATIAIVVLSIIWLYRVVGNHRAIGRNTTWSSGWAIGGWFVPPLVVYAVPMLVLRESWKASDPAVPPGDERWRQSPVNPIVYVWWVLYGLAPIVFIVAGVTFETSGFGQDADDLAESLARRPGLHDGARHCRRPVRCRLGVARPRPHAPATSASPARHGPVDTPDAVSTYLVRHAKAGSRHRWDGDDFERPVSASGRKQADAMAARLVDAGVTSLWSSPYVRCIETLEPLADLVGLPIHTDERLVRGCPVRGHPAAARGVRRRCGALHARRRARRKSRRH